MPEDVVDLIVSDHRAIAELLEQVKAEPERRPQLLASLASMLAAHSRAEEDEVYPVAREGAGDSDHQVQHSYEEHEQVELLLEDAGALEPDSTHFEAKFAELEQALRHHVDEEESAILPRLRERLDSVTLEELGEAFSRRRYQELQITDL